MIDIIIKLAGIVLMLSLSFMVIASTIVLIKNSFRESNCIEDNDEEEENKDD